MGQRAPFWEATAGSAEAGQERPVDPGGFFRIGSITKAFLATVVLQLAAEDRIALDPIRRQAPDLLPIEYAPVTLRQPLQHTSGVPNYLPHVICSTRSSCATGTGPRRPRSCWPSLSTSRRAFAPGTGLGYSNPDYVLLGLLVRELTGRRWDEEVARRITRPLAMASTFAPRDDPGLTRRLRRRRGGSAALRAWPSAPGTANAVS